MSSKCDIHLKDKEEDDDNDDDDDDDDDDDERSWKTSFRREMKISIIFNVAKKDGIADKIWMKLRSHNVSTRPCFCSLRFVFSKLSLTIFKFSKV